MLSGLARHAAAVPVAETDLLAAWLAGEAGVDVPDSGPADGRDRRRRETSTAGSAEPRADVPWPRSAPVRAGRADRRRAARRGRSTTRRVIDGHNLAGEPRGSIAFDMPADEFATVVDLAVADELTRRGAWARCVQIVGALDAARGTHRRPHPRAACSSGGRCSKFQAVQHSLAAMAGEIERARAATALAVAAAADYGFDSPQTDYAVTVAKVAVGRAVGPVTTIAHQLHGAIGVTIEHRLWLATMRARSWVDEFGTPRTTRGGWAGWRWPPTIRGMSSSAVQHLVDARLDVGTSRRVGRSMPNRSVSASSTSRRGVEADPLALALAVDGQVAAAQVPPRVVGDERAGEPGDEDRLRDTLTHTNFRLRRSISGCGRVVNM